ncbi:hypothetical protein Tco_0416711, partial [Tanacetum coccineum]
MSLYNTLIESYNSDKDHFASYGDMMTLKQGLDVQDKDEGPLDQTEGQSEEDQARKSHQKKQLKRSPSLQVLLK